jgi:hypothetical protein
VLHAVKCNNCCRLMQDMHPVKAMKHVAQFILSTHTLFTAKDSDSSPLLVPFFSFVLQCLTYFSELIDTPAGADIFNAL